MRNATFGAAGLLCTFCYVVSHPLKGRLIKKYLTRLKPASLLSNKWSGGMFPVKL